MTCALAHVICFQKDEEFQMQDKLIIYVLSVRFP